MAQINSEVSTSDTIAADRSINIPAPAAFHSKKMIRTSGSNDLLCTKQRHRVMTCPTKLES